MMERLSTSEICKVVDTLIGPTTAVGDSCEDEAIEKNLKNAIDLVDWLLEGIADSARTRHRFEGSMRDIGQRAYTALCEWMDWLDTEINMG